MLCPELFRRGKRTIKTAISLGHKVNFDNYEFLHEDGKRLVIGWFDRAYKYRNCPPEMSFEPFIFAWIAFNSWGMCVTGYEHDRDIIDALAVSRKLSKDFDELMDESKEFRKAAEEFHGMWPIFRVQAIRRKGLQYLLPNRNRDDVIKYYLEHGVRDYEPRCWGYHKERGEDVPLDWPHTLNAVYRVRCNLFHGQKAAHSEMDQKIVSLAFRTIVLILEKQGIRNRK